ncbi:hypothetical protein IAD21_03527 [Abditibacteriota bacterium]|nr:hypothetical protein IAD21_03527 [Abditibacteriota bacterium]
MNDLLKELIGRLVEVHSRGGKSSFRDEGRLTAYDEHWIKLDNGEGEVLYFSVANIRLVKPLD